MKRNIRLMTVDEAYEYEVNKIAMKQNSRAALEAAREELQKTLSAPRKEPLDNEAEDELNQIKMKLNSKMTLEEARAALKRTQSMLGDRR
jgi:hypothetical protein